MTNHLPTTSNLENLSLQQKADLANRKGKECFDYHVKSAIAGYECGLALIAIREQIEKEQGKRKFTAWLDNDWVYSRQYAYRFIEFASDAMCQQLLTDNPDLTFNAASKLMKGLSSKEKTQRQIEDENLEQQIARQEAELIALKAENENLKIEKELDNQLQIIYLKKRETFYKKEVDLARLRATPDYDQKKFELNRDKVVFEFQEYSNIAQFFRDKGFENSSNEKIQALFTIDRMFTKFKDRMVSVQTQDDRFDLLLDMHGVPKEFKKQLYAKAEERIVKDELEEIEA